MTSHPGMWHRSCGLRAACNASSRGCMTSYPGMRNRSCGLRAACKARSRGCSQASFRGVSVELSAPEARNHVCFPWSRFRAYGVPMAVSPTFNFARRRRQHG
jgi:hypothetical protein